MLEEQTDRPRPLEWIGSSKKDLMALPEEVVDLFGYALQLALIRTRLKAVAKRAKELEDEQT